MAQVTKDFHKVSEFLSNYTRDYNFNEEADIYKNEIRQLIELLNDSDKEPICYIYVINTIQGILYIDYDEAKCLMVAYSERVMRNLLQCIPMNMEFISYFDGTYIDVVKEYLTCTSPWSEGYSLKGMRVSDINQIDMRRDLSHVQIIESKKSPVVAEFKEYISLNGRIKNEKFVLEGELLVYRALRDGLPVEKVVYSNNIDEESIKEIIELCKKNKIAYYKSTAGIMAAMSTTHPSPDILCSVRMKLLNEKDLIISNKGNVFLVLDGISSPDNLGIILRTADAAGISAVVLLSNSTHFMNKNVIRGARGAIGKIPIYYSNNDSELFDKLKKNNFKIIGTSARLDSHNFYEINFNSNNLAIVIGNESKGVRKEILDQCTEYAKIPMVEGQSSLNIAVASALMIYEYVRTFY